MPETFLVTGSVGCIGAWTLRNLVDDGANIIATDLTSDRSRPELLLSDEELNDAMTWLELDVTDGAAMRAAVDDHGVTHIVHLAGLQIPFCRADPALGASVNVVGTVNVLEAARHAGVAGVSYASSVAALGPPEAYDTYPLGDDIDLKPVTLYGVYKVANEATARIYWDDWQVASVGLRPHNVYGVCRDQGMSADVAKAILAAAAGRPFHIRFGGLSALQHASDVARTFIASARSGHRGAATCNLRNDVIEVSAVVEMLATMVPGAQISFEEGTSLPFPADLDDSGLRDIIGTIPHTPLADAMASDIALYRELLAKDRIDLGQLDR